MSAVEPNREPAPDEYPTLKEPSFDGENTALQETALQETPEAAERPRRNGALNHADPVSIGIGLVFFLIGGAYLLATGGHLTVNAGWTLSLLLLGLGLSGVIGGLLKSRRGDGPDRR